MAGLAAKFTSMRKLGLTERQWREYLGIEARTLGHGGIKAVARAAGVSEGMVSAGVSDVESGGLDDLPAGRSRRPGGGRKKLADKDPGLREAFAGILEEATRGDPMAEVTYCSLSLRDIEREMAGRGFACGKDTIARMLRAEGFSLQSPAKVLEGKKQHPDRNAQFGNINAKISRYREDGEPVISVDTKKKELTGPFHRAGQAWRPAGDPVRVRDHSFPDKDSVRIVPYGIYDIAANRGFVSVGVSCDTGAFAVNAIRLWWQKEGSLRYPRATRLLITCDSGGSNDWRFRLWKDQLAQLAEETGLVIEVCHFPPGTSKWNKIEHRLFCHITRAWRGRPLMTVDDAVAGIAATATSQGLKCTAVVDGNDYPDGIEIPGARMKYLQDRVIDRGEFHGEWNYAILPVPRPAPEPEPEPEPAGPDPALLQALAALAGIPAPRALLEDITPAWNAGREYRLALDRGRERLRPHGKSYRKLSDEAVLTAAACRIRLGMTWTLLGRLLGVYPSSISDQARWAIPVLGEHGITAQPGTPRITTARLAGYAAAAGITLTIPSPPPRPAKCPACKHPKTTTCPKLKKDAHYSRVTTRDHEGRPARRAADRTGGGQTGHPLPNNRRLHTRMKSSPKKLFAKALAITRASGA